MIKPLILLPFLFLIGCGEYNPCGPDYPTYVDNVCIQTNGFPVDFDEFEYTLHVTEEAYNGFYPNNPVDIRKLLEDNRIYLSYDYKIAPHILGVTAFSHDYEKTLNTVEKDFMIVLGYNCWFRNVVLGHEILHVIAAYHQGVSMEENHLHMIPNVFLIWAAKNNVPKGFTAEYTIASALTPYCEQQIDASGHMR